MCIYSNNKKIQLLPRNNKTCAERRGVVEGGRGDCQEIELTQLKIKQSR